MLAGGLPEPALDMVRGGKRRVHHDDRRRDGTVEAVINCGCIVSPDRSFWEQFPQQGTAGLREFIQRQPRARSLGEDSQHAGSSRGFEHQIVGTDPRSLGDNGRKGQSGRELLQTHAVLRTPRVRRREAGEAFHHGE